MKKLFNKIASEVRSGLSLLLLIFLVFAVIPPLVKLIIWWAGVWGF